VVTSKGGFRNLAFQRLGSKVVSSVWIRSIGSLNMSTREVLVQFGPGVILVQLKDRLQVPCGFSGSAGTIIHLTPRLVAKR
jgi:hypothetical protein